MKRELNAFDKYSYISRQSNDCNNEPSLKDSSSQIELHELALKKWQEYLESTDINKSSKLDYIVAIYRKLREGLVSSQRIDEFTLTVYESSVDICFENNNYQELVKTLVRLLDDIYPSLYPSKQDRRSEMSVYYVLYLICYAKRANELHGSLIDIRRFYLGLPQDIQDSESMSISFKLLSSLSNLNYNQFNSLVKNFNLNQQKLIQSATSSFIHRMISLHQKSYMNLSLNVLETRIPTMSEKEVLELLVDKGYKIEKSMIYFRVAK